jgi:hypothetical protein
VILHRPPLWNRHTKKVRPGLWHSRSLATVAEPGDLDLRDRKHAEELARTLEQIDLEKLVAAMKHGAGNG